MGLIDKKREEEEKRAVNSYLYPAIICDDSENGSIFSEKFFSQEKRGQVVKIAIDSTERSQRVSTWTCRSRKWGIFAEISKLNRQITDS